MDRKLNIVYAPLSSLRHPEKNPRKWSKEATEQLEESVKRHGIVDPLVINGAENRKGTIIGGNFRYEVFKKMGLETVPVVYIDVPDPKKEAELIIRLNKNVGDWDWTALAEFDEAFLADSGFDSQTLDEIFAIDPTPEEFNLTKELEKLDIKEVDIKKCDVFEFNGCRLMCGDSTVEEDVVKLMNGQKADMCLTDPPYILDYLRGKSRGKDGATTGFGLKKNRRYLETDVLPDNFTELWMANIAKVQKDDFSIIIFENPKNLRTIWNELEKHWKYRNTIVWRVSNRIQGFSAKYKFFNKHDIALVGTAGKVELNIEPESDELFQSEYENALFATSGYPHWEGYEKGKKVCPTDFIDHIASDKKHSGQGVIFGTKPIEILLPYLKVLTKRGGLVVEPFGGSGSTLIASIKLGRKCYIMEKSPVYAEVIKKRWEKLIGKPVEKTA